MADKEKRDKLKEAEEEVAVEAEEAEETRDRVVRHTISAEETFTLAKDVFDLRCFFKNVYANRAVIARRLNIFSLICSLLFTMLYTAYTVYSVLADKLSFGMEVAVYCMLSVYAVFLILLVIITFCAGDATTQTVKKYNKALKVFRFCIRVISIAMAIVAISISAGAAKSPLSIALQAVLIILSIICIVVQGIPLMFGGFSNLARWALAPAKGKARFSVVVLEWYELVRKGSGERRSTRKISPRYLEDINRCIDGYLIPFLGKKYIMSVDATDIYSATESVPEELKDIAEGIFKCVFDYAEECGYVNLNPTKGMELGGSLEEPEKPRRSIKNRLMNIGKKLGKSIVKSYLDGEDER